MKTFFIFLGAYYELATADKVRATSLSSGDFLV